MGNQLHKHDDVRYAFKFVNKRVKVKNDSPHYAFLTAAKENNVGKVEALLSKGVSVNCVTFHQDDMKTALHYAALEGHVRVIKTLISHGCDVNLAPSENRTPPLLLACSSGKIAAVQLLLEAGANVNLSTKYGHSPLLAASAAGHIQIVKLLVRYGANLDLVSHCGDYKYFDDILQSSSRSWNRMDVSLFGNSALMHACLEQHLVVARFLLQNGCEVNIPSPIGCTALHLAAFSQRKHIDVHRGPRRPQEAGHPGIVQELLNHGAKLNVQNKLSETPLTRTVRGMAILAGANSQNKQKLLKDLHENLKIIVQNGGSISGGEESIVPYLEVIVLILPDLLPVGDILMLLHSCGLSERVVMSVLSMVPEGSSEKYKELQAVLAKKLDAPSGLKEMCRKVIRANLDHPICQTVHVLPLPTSIKEYICLKKF